MDDQAAATRLAALIRLISPFGDQPSSLEAYEIDWDFAWQFSAVHSVRPSLARAITVMPAAPAALRSQLADFMRVHSFEVLQKVADIVPLSRALSDAGITAVFFKGAVLAKQAYGAAERREFNDIDLLICETRRDAAIALLQTLGYGPVIEDPALRRAFFDYGGQHSFLNRQTGSVVDLHWNFAGEVPFPVGCAQVLRNKTVLEIGGAGVPVPDTDDLALILAGHGQKEGWASFSWVLDFATFAASHPQIDWKRVADRARSKGCRRSVLTAILLVEHLFSHALDIDLKRLAEQDAAIAQDIAGIVARYELLAERDLASDMNGALRLCETRLQRARVWFNLLTTRTIGDYEAWPLPPRLWWLYYGSRPFRLLANRLSGAPAVRSVYFEERRKALRSGTGRG